MPEVTISESALEASPLGALQEFADAVGVGYAGLEEEELRDRLRFEGFNH